MHFTLAPVCALLQSFNRICREKRSTSCKADCTCSQPGRGMHTEGQHVVGSQPCLCLCLCLLNVQADLKITALCRKASWSLTKKSSKQPVLDTFPISMPHADKADLPLHQAHSMLILSSFVLLALLPLQKLDKKLHEPNLASS